jgi:predicted anti-sigma-YlaC factor YlaD
MKRKQTNNIDYVTGWLCGAVFVVTPVVAVLYLLRHRWRPAFQAGVIGVTSLLFIIAARALMLAVGVQHKRFEWIGLNVLVFLVIPSVATAVVSAISWPRQSSPQPGGGG